VRSVREIRRLRRLVRIGAPDPSLTRYSGMVAVTELVDRLNMIKLLDRAIGSIKTRDRGLSGGELLVGMAAAQLAGEDFLVGLDRQRADAAGKVLAPVAGLCSTTAAGLARRFTDGQWHAVETGIGDIGAAMLAALPAERAAALCEQVTIDLDTTDVEVYGRHKRAVAYNYQGQRCGRPHVATWAETATVLAADLMAGNEDPRPHAGALLNRALAALPAQARAGRILAARGRRLPRRPSGPGRSVRRCRVRHRRQARRSTVAVPERRPRGRLDRRDRHGRRAGRRGRVLPGLVARDHRLLIRRVALAPSRSAPTRGRGAAALCTPSSRRCRSPTSPASTRSTPTRSS
jgi:Transposase DDE domain group 1